MNPRIFALCPSGALPVTLTKFETNIAGKQIKLNSKYRKRREFAILQ